MYVKTSKRNPGRKFFPGRGFFGEIAGKWRFRLIFVFWWHTFPKLEMNEKENNICIYMGWQIALDSITLDLNLLHKRNPSPRIHSKPHCPTPNHVITQNFQTWNPSLSLSSSLPLDPSPQLLVGLSLSLSVSPSPSLWISKTLPPSATLRGRGRTKTGGRGKGKVRRRKRPPFLAPKSTPSFLIPNEGNKLFPESLVKIWFCIWVLFISTLFQPNLSQMPFQGKTIMGLQMYKLGWISILDFVFSLDISNQMAYYLIILSCMWFEVSITRLVVLSL